MLFHSINWISQTGQYIVQQWTLLLGVHCILCHEFNRDSVKKKVFHHFKQLVCSWIYEKILEMFKKLKFNKVMTS